MQSNTEATQESPSESGSMSDETLPRDLLVSAQSIALWKVWLVCLVCILVCMVPMTLGISSADTTRTMEKISLLSSAESWRNVHEQKPDAFMIPTWNGRERVNKPPMLVWLNMLAWADLDPATASPDLLVTRSRLLALILVAVMLASIFWMGWHLGDFYLAIIAVLVAGTMFGLARQARFASYDTHLGAWVALSIVGALWAMRPMKKDWGSWRIIPGILIAGLGLGMAILTKGPISFLMAVVPVVAMWWVGPRFRWSGLLVIAGMLVLGGAFASPWYVYIFQHVQGAAETQGTEWGATRNAYISPLNYVFFLVKGTMPWGLWFLAGLLLCLLRGRGDRRRQFAMPLVWFLVIFVIMCIPAAKQDRYLFPLFPAIALIIAQVWREHEWQKEQQGRDPGAWILVYPHWIILAIVSVLLPVFILLQREIMGWGIGLKEVILDGLSYRMVVLMGVAMLVFCWNGFKSHILSWRPFNAAVFTALWAGVMLSLVLQGYSNSVKEINPARQSGLYLFNDAKIRAGTMAYLYIEEQDLRPIALKADDEAAWMALHEDQKYYRDVQNLEPNEEFLFYAGRQIFAAHWEDLEASTRPVYLLVRAPKDEAERVQLYLRLSRLGYWHQSDLDDDHHPSWANFTNMILFASGPVAESVD